MILQNVQDKSGDEELNFLFFWGHKKHPSPTKQCFSQWYELGFTIDGVHYKTAEHWMMTEKARLFGDDEILSKIIDVPTPREAQN